MPDHVLITRPEEDAKILAAILKAKGYEVTCIPFLKVILHEVKLPDLNAYEGLVFTSANGVRAFCHNSNVRDMPVLTVGTNTAEAAQEFGFSTIEDAAGDALDLRALLSGKSSDKPYLYIHGRHISRTIDPNVAGVQIEGVETYHTEKIEEISSESTELLAAGGFSHVLFFSKRTAESFVEFAQSSACTPDWKNGLKRTKALCLGSSMIKCLSVLPWKDMLVSARPDRDGMLALLD